MGNENTLPIGRVFEKEILGFTEEEQGYYRCPAERKFRNSMQRIISEIWTLYAEGVEKGVDCYNPTNPNQGKTALLFAAVKVKLPRRMRGAKIPLNFYPSVGRNALDRYYKIDAFFWWGGAFVTIDISLVPPQFKDLRADFILNPEDMEPERLSILGKKIADLLKERRKKVRSKEVRSALRKKVDVIS